MTPAEPKDGEVGVVGVDGWRGGWVAATQTGAELRWRAHETFADLLAAYPYAHVGVDMPIGLSRHGYRDCDVAARAFLGPARSSVFLTPTRATVATWSPGAAHPLGRGISRQTWNLLPRVVELDALLTGRPDLARRVAEVHPECSFRALAPQLVFESKKTARGAGQRLAALRTWMQLPELIEAPRAVPVDDILDATAVAWTVHRWRYRPERLLTFGSAAVDEKGLTMRIIA